MTMILLMSNIDESPKDEEEGEEEEEEEEKEKEKEKESDPAQESEEEGSSTSSELRVDVKGRHNCRVFWRYSHRSANSGAQEEKE